MKKDIRIFASGDEIRVIIDDMQIIADLVESRKVENEFSLMRDLKASGFKQIG